MQHFFYEMEKKLYMLEVEVSAETEGFKTQFLTRSMEKLFWPRNRFLVAIAPGTQNNFHRQF